MNRRGSLSILTAVFLSALGFAMLSGVFNHLSPSEDAEVTLQLRVRGVGQRPISGAEIWLTRPQNKLIGITNNRGVAKSKVILPKGRMAVVEARGRTFRASKELHIPNVSSYEMRINLDPREARNGMMELETITAEKTRKKARNDYHQAINRIDRTNKRRKKRNIQVSISNNQPLISRSAQTTLAQIRNETKNVARGMFFQLKKSQVSLVELRLLKAKGHILEIVLRDIEGKIRGARLVPAATLKPQHIKKHLLRAVDRQDENRKASFHNTPVDRLWSIRKRPVDQILTFLNGEFLPSRRDHDRIISLLPSAFSPTASWQLSATSQSGLAIQKNVNPSTAARPIRWTWPEWAMSQRPNQPDNF